ncbi:DUF3226 domain-containing protein [Spirulina sp. CCNP1310]|uniref:DUF3226 domain-containing protein n=1 Tax=Spirulina sp. CCNP1310 TaxID=3110249 RepID=UPI002B21B14F|nr:DUF3226 domain-containing protein [Spirulina sp. CCNP1310]MEA5420677.1 DUF3226 domain-containing protein [Spirulina sp. CCNP1310]
MINKNHSKILLVEGVEDLRIIPKLIEANGVPWVKAKQPVVFIDPCNGYDNLVNPDLIATWLQASGLLALGIIIDADENPEERWQSIRNASLNNIPDLPKSLPEEGLIHITAQGIRFGIWMMPDNKICGMLETFIAYMIPSTAEELWQFAQTVTREAQTKGAKFKAVHEDKAKIYSWLAWQNPPGRQLHQAIKQRILTPQNPDAQKFVTWFKKLYQLENESSH